MNCAPLIDIRHMKSASACHACGRCSDYKGAVELAGRSPASEILNTGNHEVKTQEALTLLFGIIGIATAAMLWSSSAYFIRMKTILCNWLIELNSFFLLQDNAPWWLLTHYPATNQVFTWLDGLCILIFILGGGIALGLIVFGCIQLAALVADRSALSWQCLTLSLVPIAGVGVFLGLSMLTLSHLKSEGISLAGVPFDRAAMLAAGSAFSVYLGWKLTAVRFPIRRVLAFAITLLPVALLDSIWIATFFT